ncbi:MAG: hypothetical protein ACXITV_07255 [Luteibaculaceae bacterium]
MIKGFLKKAFSKVGLTLESNYLTAQRALYASILEKILIATEGDLEKDKLSIIIFSKDRAFQLQALLASLHYFSKDLPPCFVLYKASNNAFGDGYKKLINLTAEPSVTFTEEQHFKQDLLSLISNVKTEKVLFLVDDIFFKNPIDFNAFARLNVHQFVPSLRHGDNLNFAYTVNKPQRIPRFEKNSKHPEMLVWNYYQEEYDWAYPLSVDGHLFSTQEMKILLENTTFKAPNSLEAAMQVVYPLFSKRKGICFHNSVIVNNPCNKVQSEHFNFHGNDTAAYLNEQWLEGMVFNFLAYAGFQNKSVHEELPIVFSKVK